MHPLILLLFRVLRAYAMILWQIHVQMDHLSLLSTGWAL